MSAPPGGLLPPAPWLLADIGGTNARFGWMAAHGQPVTLVRSLEVSQHAGPAAAVAAYLAAVAPLTDGAAPRSAALAVASAVGEAPFVMTNSGWLFDRAALARALGLEVLVLLNDFEALALSLPGLTPAQWRSHDGRAPQPRQALAVIGPGTGLGVAGVVARGGHWQAVPGEGGHVTLSAADALEDAVLQQVRRRHDHVSAERLLSGIGLPLLHDALGAVQGTAGASLATEELVQRGLDGDAAARRTLELFCALLGGFAGNVALTLGARGGVFIGGGIVPRLGDFFFASAFRERFEAKGRFRPYMQAIPTAVITDTLAALGGAAAALDQSLLAQ